jgi:sec-independent protein translocase protein TatA
MAFLSPSPIELIVILVIALLVLGPSRLPETARSLGRGMRELRESLQGIGDRDDDEDDDGSAEIDPPPPRRDDPGGLPVDPAVVMGDVPYDDDLPDELPGQPEPEDYQKEAESRTPSASS